MTPHDDTIRLRHMLDHAREAVEMGRGRRREDLTHNRMLQLALVRLVEILGEAAARVSPQGQERYASIPWAQASAMRNRLIHGYDKVDLDVLWDTVQDDLPALIGQLRQALGEGG
jgi:uncharacterized protein with HEPN domain